MIRLTVIYPSTKGDNFDWDYYTNEHMKLVEEKFGEHMVRAEVAKGVRGVPEGDASYLCLSHMYFESKDDMKAAFKNAGMSIMEDIANFTDITPVQQVEELLVD